MTLEGWIVSRLRRQPAILYGIGVLTAVILMLISTPALRLGWFLLIFLTLLSWSLLYRWESRVWTRRFLLIAVMIHVGIALALYCISFRYWIPTEAGLFQNGGFFIGDGYVYAYNGHWLADRWSQGIFPTDEALRDWSMSKTTTPYDYWSGWIIYALGYHPLTPIFLNCLLGSWSAVFAYWLAQKFLSEQTARWAGLAVAFWPSLLLWSTQNLKEPISLFLMLGCLVCWMRPSIKQIWWSWPLGAGALMALHQMNHFIGPLVVCAWLLYGLVILLMKFRWMRWLITLVTAGFILLVLFGDTGPLLSVSQQLDQIIFKRPVLEFALNPDQFAQQIEYLRRVRMLDAATPILESYQIKNFIELAAFLPISWLALLTMPLPWMARSAHELMGAAEMLLWYPLLYYAFRGALQSLWSQRSVLLLTILAAVIGTAIALLEGNVGTLFRHRASLWPWLLMLACYGWEIKQMKEHPSAAAG